MFQACKHKASMYSQHYGRLPLQGRAAFLDDLAYMATDHFTIVVFFGTCVFVIVILLFPTFVVIAIMFSLGIWRLRSQLAMSFAGLRLLEARRGEHVLENFSEWHGDFCTVSTLSRIDICLTQCSSVWV